MAKTTLLSCPKCNRKDLKGCRGLSIHLSRGYHYTPPPPEPVPEIHVPFRKLAEGNWGKSKPRGKWTAPTDNDLMLGYLARIADALDDIKADLRKPKTLQ